MVAEDLWAEGRLKALAAEIELWYFLSLNEASKIMMLKLPEFKDLILESVRGPTRAKFLAGSVTGSRSCAGRQCCRRS